MRSYQMSWIPKLFRWSKMVDGKRYVVSVRQLRKYFNERFIPETKEGSYQWANKWIEQQRNQAIKRVEEPVYHLELFDMETNEPTGEFINVKKSDYDSQYAAKMETKNRFNRFWDSLHDAPEILPDKLIGSLVDKYLETQFQRHKAGDIGVSEISNTRYALINFRDFAGSHASIETINAESWEKYYFHLISDKAKSIAVRRKYFGYAKSFVLWLSDKGLITQPTNLTRKQYRFKGGAKAVPTIPTEVVKNVLNHLKGILHLHVLLMLNCGFTQVDISDLTQAEVDWTHGRIKRKRSKEDDHEDVPVVDYILWDQTFELLKKHRSHQHPTLALTTKSGRAWLRDRIDKNGKRGRCDSIGDLYKEIDIAGRPPLKQFRKFSSKMIDDNNEHGRYAKHFLGQRPFADRHYLSKNCPEFDNAVLWLGSQILG